MDEAIKYVVKKYLKHNKDTYRPGSTIELGNVDSLPLLAKGIIAVPTATTVIIETVTVPAVVPGASTLSKFNLVELQELAGALGLDVNDQTKDQLIEKITAAQPVKV